MNIELIKSTENSAPNPGALLSVVNPEVATPLYIQIREHFQSGIQSGVYPVHTRLPSERQLAESFKVSRMTLSPKQSRSWNSRAGCMPVQARERYLPHAPKLIRLLKL